MAYGGEYILEQSISVTEDEPSYRSHDISAERRERELEFEANKRQNESLLEWFDRSIEDELSKKRNVATHAIPTSPGLRHPNVAEAAASVINIIGELQGEPDTELSEAAERFATAEAVVAFEGAVRAAEQAAASAPPELAEEAAVAGAKDFQAELTNVFKHDVPGIRPIEVIGYVGMTKPSVPYPSSARQNEKFTLDDLDF